MVGERDQMKKVVFRLKDSTNIVEDPISGSDSKVKGIFVSMLKDSSVDFSFCVNKKDNCIVFLTYLNPINSMFLLRKISNKISEDRFFIDRSIVLRVNNEESINSIVNCYEPGIDNPNLLNTYMVVNENYNDSYRSTDREIIDNINKLENVIRKEYGLDPNIREFMKYKNSVGFLSKD
jgi:hypothetical protein